jgi:hypothetical protein
VVVFGEYLLEPGHEPQRFIMLALAVQAALAGAARVEGAQLVFPASGMH